MKTTRFTKRKWAQPVEGNFPGWAQPILECILCILIGASSSIVIFRPMRVRCMLAFNRMVEEPLSKAHEAFTRKAF